MKTPSISVLVFALSTLITGPTAFGAGLSDAFASAGVEKHSVAYYKILSTLNIAPFHIGQHGTRGSSFKMCKRRWLSSPAGAFNGLTVEGTTEVTHNSDDGPVSTKGTFTESMANVTDESFELHFMVKVGDDKQEGVMKVDRANFIVTCQEMEELRREVAKEFKIKQRIGEPRLAKVAVGEGSYQTIARTDTMDGVYPNGKKFSIQTYSADGYFGVYRRAYDRVGLMMMMGKDDKVEQLMAVKSTISKISVKASGQ